MRYSIITFPGTSGDHDCQYVASQRGNIVNKIWHKDTDLKNPDVVIFPGGSSYGDYLRCGALAIFSPIIQEVIKYVNDGGLVLGICNGFQILTEMGLLPGTLTMNRNLKFICKHQYFKVVNEATPFTCAFSPNTVVTFPIAHKIGNYYIDDYGLQELKDNEQIVFRYCDEEGNVNDESNPNGSVDNIAAITNKEGNVLGMMPHPERNAQDFSGTGDCSRVFASLEKFYTPKC